jgi:uroporphyrinogen-III synthase
MVSTRSGNHSSSAKQDDNAAAGTKRKEHAVRAEPEHDTKAAKKQTKIEDSLAGNKEQDKGADSEMKDAPADKEANGSAPEEKEHSDKKDEQAETKEGDTTNPKAEGGGVERDTQREKNMPSNILEKGLIYFFTRNRVGIEDSDSVGDLQRTYFVLRPFSAAGAKLVDGAIPDEGNNRLFALPKKTFPKSHRDRFMAFVEKPKTSIQDLKDNFFKATEYETKTAGTRRQEPVRPIGEGVYAITRTEDRTTHLAYSLTIPTELGEVQEDLGLRSQGSFVISVKNPERGGPANARLPQGPDYPKAIIEEFRGLAWAEVQPKYLDYQNTQILLIGENTEKAVEPTRKDEKQGKTAPKEELDQLAHEDELRVEHLRGDDTVFEDLDISKKEYSEVPTTW